MSRIIIELFEEVEPVDPLARWVARVVGSSDPNLSQDAATPASALGFLAEYLFHLPFGGVTLIRTARPQLEIPA